MAVTISTRRRIARVACALIAVVCWLGSPAAITGEGQQQTPPQGQQGCPAPNTQANGQQANGQQTNNGQQGQQNGSQQNGANNQQNANCNQPAPLFSGSLSIKKSSQSTDTTAFGFNGVDPNGQVQQAFLNSAPSAESEKKAVALAANQPSPADLAAFEKEGGLNQPATPPAAPKSN